MEPKMNEQTGRKSSENDCLSGVHCDVSNCTYNDKKCNCYADKINVGPTFANKTDDTICATFKQQ
jgi:hypothetical protein